MLVVEWVDPAVLLLAASTSGRLDSRGLRAAAVNRSEMA
jgi:hypothetical protein